MRRGRRQGRKDPRRHRGLLGGVGRRFGEVLAERAGGGLEVEVGPGAGLQVRDVVPAAGSTVHRRGGRRSRLQMQQREV